jgi:hypothetical protein
MHNFPGDPNSKGFVLDNIVCSSESMVSEGGCGLVVFCLQVRGSMSNYHEIMQKTWRMIMICILLLMTRGTGNMNEEKGNLIRRMKNTAIRYVWKFLFLFLCHLILLITRNRGVDTWMLLIRFSFGYLSCMLVGILCILLFKDKTSSGTYWIVWNVSLFFNDFF